MRGDDAICGRLSRRAAHQRPPLGDPSWAPPAIIPAMRSRSASANASRGLSAGPRRRPGCARCGIADCSRSTGNLPSRWRPMILSARLNCSLRMFNEPVRISYRVPPFRPHQFDPHQDASATQCRISRKPERTKIDIFSAPRQWTHSRISREASRTEIFAGKTPVRSLFCYYGASSGLRIVYTLGSQR
jgi:hypothetical protein